MRQFIVLSFAVCCLATGNPASGQDFLDQLGRQLQRRGRQELEQRIRRSTGQQRGGQQGNPQQGGEQPRSRSLPSEGGQRSGPGGNQEYREDGGDGFRLERQNPNQRVQPFPQGQTPFPQAGVVVGSDLPTAPVNSSEYVVIRCPQSSSGSCRYTLSSSRGNFGFTMSGGKEQRFRQTTRWVISYHDGVQQRRYRLDGGTTYTLKQVEGNRWQLYSVAHPGS